MWKVIVLFNEKRFDDDPEIGTYDYELTLATEKYFDSYAKMREYVFTCESNGAVGGMVFKYRATENQWEYYMDIQ